jgi:septal ring factor EnvC (AmiA/AmiB activator)
MEKIFTRTEFYNGVQNGENEANVKGRFIESEVLDIYKSKTEGKEIFRKKISCEIMISSKDVTDIVSHEILNKDVKSERLKKRFAAAWADFEKNKGKIALDGGAQAQTAVKEAAQKTTELYNELKKKDKDLQELSGLLEQSENYNAELETKIKELEEKVLKNEKEGVKK